jgi:hypothetical protein
MVYVAPVAHGALFAVNGCELTLSVCVRACAGAVGGGQHVKEGWWCYDALGAGRGRQGNCKRYRIAPNTACVKICEIFFVVPDGRGESNASLCLWGNGVLPVVSALFCKAFLVSAPLKGQTPGMPCKVTNPSKLGHAYEPGFFC